MMPVLGTRIHSERTTVLLFYFLILFRVEEGVEWQIKNNYVEDNILIAAFKFWALKTCP